MALPPEAREVKLPPLTFTVALLSVMPSPVKPLMLALMFSMPPLVLMVALTSEMFPLLAPFTAASKLTFNTPLVEVIVLGAATVPPDVAMLRFARKLSVSRAVESLFVMLPARLMLLPELTVKLPAVTVPSVTSPVVVLSMTLPEPVWLRNDVPAMLKLRASKTIRPSPDCSMAKVSDTCTPPLGLPVVARVVLMFNVPLLDCTILPLLCSITALKVPIAVALMCSVPFAD